MTTHTRRPLVALGALVVGLTVAVFGATPLPAPAQGSAATQTREAGGVTVAVTWQAGASGLTFKVVLDTHSVNLDDYDLAQLAVVRTDQGQEVAPISWQAPLGGHHREGTLTFPWTTDDGTSLLGGGTRAIELVIRNVAGVPERSFRWTVA